MKTTAPNITDVAPLLAPHFLDLDFDAELTHANLQLINDHSHILGVYHKYINKLHDSEILEVTNDGNNVTLTLNDIGTLLFAEALIVQKKIKINSSSLRFPITIKFNSAQISYHTVDDDGILHNIPSTTLNEYLYEQVIGIKNGIIRIGIVAWQARIGKPGRRILLLLNAKSVETIEDQRRAWTTYFGTAINEYYNYYISLFATGEYMADQTLCEALIVAYDTREK